MFIKENKAENELSNEYFFKQRFQVKKNTIKNLKIES